MSKAATALAERLRIFNPHNASTFAGERGGAGVYVTYRPEQRGRVYTFAAWQVVRPGYKTDPGGHWMDHGHKTFGVRSVQERSAVLEEALEWASRRYGVTDWEKIPGIRGTYFPAGDARIIRDALQEADGEAAH